MTDLQKSMRNTFLTLRLGVGVLGIAFPFILWLGGLYFYDLHLRGSMSAYYHASHACTDPAEPHEVPIGETDPCEIVGSGSMRNYFVGVLFVMGAVMGLYRGFSLWEDIALTVAGISAVVIAVNPMEWTAKTYPAFSPHVLFSVHTMSAVTFFLCMVFVCTLCSEKTLRFAQFPQYGGHNPNAYRFWYALFALLMLISPISSLWFDWVTKQNRWGYWLEAFGILAFGAFWLVKTLELSRTKLDSKAMEGVAPLDRKTLMGERYRPDKNPKL